MTPHCPWVVGQVYLRLKSPEDALEFCDRALHVLPTHVKALSRRAQAQADLGRMTEALQVRAAAHGGGGGLGRGMAVWGEGCRLVTDEVWTVDSLGAPVWSLPQAPRLIISPAFPRMGGRSPGGTVMPLAPVCLG
jgi:hypothetical protein